MLRIIIRAYGPVSSPFLKIEMRRYTIHLYIEPATLLQIYLFAKEMEKNVL